MRGGRCATRHPTRDRSTFKRRSSSSPGPASRLLQPAGPVTEASCTPLLVIRCFPSGACHRALAPRISTSSIASHPCRCRHGLREKFPDVFPRCDALNAPRPSKRRGCLPPAYIHLVSPVSQYRILTQPNTHPNVLVSPTQSLASYKTPPKRSTNTHLRKPVHSIASTTMMQTVDPSQPKPIQYASPPSPPASNTGSPKSMSVLNATETDKMTISTHHHILIVTGPAGCGKSTVAKHLSDRYGFDYIEGDEVS